MKICSQLCLHIFTMLLVSNVNAACRTGKQCCKNPQGKVGEKWEQNCTDLVCTAHAFGKNVGYWRELFSSERCCSMSLKVGENITETSESDKCIQHSLLCHATEEGAKLKVMVENVCPDVDIAEMVNTTNNMVKAVESKVEDIHRFISKMSDDTACLKTTNTPPSIPGSSSTTNSGDSIKKTIFRCEASFEQTQSGHNKVCDKAFDGVVDDPENGWAYFDNGIDKVTLPAWVIFYLSKTSAVNSVLIKSGTGRTTSQVNGPMRILEFEIDLMVGCGFQPATGLAVNSPNAVVTGSRIKLASGQSNLLMTFNMTADVNGVRITVLDTDADNNNIRFNEIVIMDLNVPCISSFEYLDFTINNVF